MTAHAVLYLRSRSGTGLLGARLSAEGFQVHYLRRFERLSPLCAALPCQALIAETEAIEALAGLPKARRPRVCLVLGAGTETVADGIPALREDTDPDETIARLRALLRRAHGYPPHHRLGPLGIDVLRARASLNGRPLELQPREWRALLLLANHPWQAVPTSWLVAALHPEGSASAALVPTYIGRLRRRLGSRFIETLPGVGYRLTPHERNLP